MIKELGYIKAYKELLPYCIPTVKKTNNQLFLMFPSFKDMLKYDILNCRSINKFKDSNPNKIKQIEKIIPHVEV